MTGLTKERRTAMYKKSNILRKLFIIVCITLFTLTSLPLAPDAFARDRGWGGRGRPGISQQRERREIRSNRHFRNEVRSTSHFRNKARSARHFRREGRRHIVSPRAVRRGHVIRSLPRGYRRIWHHREPYFYFGGVFYRSGISGFIAVQAPIGAVVISLPIGYQRLWYDGSVYYIYEGTFYRRVPAGYVVVEPPPALIVEDNEPSVVPPVKKASGKVSVNVPLLNVRSGPDLHYPKIYQVERGYILDIVGRSDGWLYVELPNGELGWVMAEFTLQIEG
jgi:hypothetical protein